MRRNPKLLGWNKPVKGVTRGYFLRPGSAGDPWYSLTRVGIGHGGFYFDVYRDSVRLGQAGSVYLAKQLAEEDAATLVHNAIQRDRQHYKNPGVTRYKTTAEMRRAGVPDLIAGTGTLIYESGRTVPLTGHSGHFLSAGTRGTALMRRRQVGDEGEFSVVGRHDLWGDRVRANGRRNPPKHAIPGLSAWTMYAGGTGAAEGKHAYSFEAGGRKYSISPFTRFGRHAGYTLTVFPSRTGGHVWIKPDGSENANGVGTHRSPQAAVSAARLHYGGGESARPNCGRSGGSEMAGARKGSRSAPRRNWAQIVVGVVMAVLPFVVGAIGKVLGYSVSAFNALPRAERREKLKVLLSSKAWLGTLNPVTVAMARQAAKSPAAIEAVLDLLEDHGAQAVSAGTAAASVAVKAAAAKRAAPTAVARTNGRRARRNGWTIDRPFYPWAEKEAQYAGYTDAELHYARLDARKARDTMAANARELERSGAGYGAVEQARQAEGWYADDVSTILSELHKRHGSHPRQNGKRRRNGGPSPWADNAEYEAWKRRHAAEQYARAATAAGKLSVTYGGEPTDSGSIAHGAESGHTHDMRSLGQRVRFGTALWRVADLPPSLYREASTREGREAIAAYILAHRIPPLRSNGRRSR